MEQATQHQPRQRGLSFHSNKSRDPPASPKTDKKASKHERKNSEKTHYDVNTKANPNAAMVELQPIAAALEKPTLQSLRSFQHNDTSGNPIVDPDLSNPTRSRWERPLDTIRSFEAAIDGEYKRRVQSMRVDQSEVMSGYNSRRSSFYGGSGGAYNDQKGRYSTAGGYHPQRQTQRDSYIDGYNHGGPVGGGPPPRMRYGNRMQSDSGFNNRQSMQGVYPVNGYQQSRDTVNTNGSNGSHSDGPYSNDPSSENSSIERGAVQPPQQDVGGQYGFNGFGRGPIMEEHSGGPGYFSQQPSHNGMSSQNGVPPPVPKHATPPAQAQAPIKLGSSGPSATETRPNTLSKKGSDAGEKRKSWFKRRFSKD